MNESTPPLEQAPDVDYNVAQIARAYLRARQTLSDANHEEERHRLCLCDAVNRIGLRNRQVIVTGPTGQWAAILCDGTCLSVDDQVEPYVDMPAPVEPPAATQPSAIASEAVPEHQHPDLLEQQQLDELAERIGAAVAHLRADLQSTMAVRWAYCLEQAQFGQDRIGQLRLEVGELWAKVREVKDE